MFNVCCLGGGGGGRAVKQIMECWELCNPVSCAKEKF